MILEALTSSYSKISEFSFIKRDDDDLVDKMFRKLSMILMLTFTVVITTFKLVGSPIDCWCMNEYSDSRCDYAKTYCYITNFYVPVSNDSSLPKKDELLSHKIQYYQWVPYIFLLQAFLFYAPCIVWRAISTVSGFDIRSYAKLLNEGESGRTDLACSFIAQHINSSIKYRHNYASRGLVKRMFSSRGGAVRETSMKLTLGYLFVKTAYLASALAQIVLLNYWLRDTSDDVSFLSLLFGKQNWNLKERFPRMTLCKFQVYILTDQQTHWVQCTLPINIYIEKIYIFLWFWLWFLIAVSLLSIAKYVLTIFGRVDASIQNALFYESNSDPNVASHASAIKSRLAYDGLLVLRLLRANTDKFNYSKVISELHKLISKDS